LEWTHTLNNDEDESILQDLVQILAAPPDFKHLTSREYDLELRESMRSKVSDDEFSEDEDEYAGTDEPAYTKASQQEILYWRPAHWWIPDHSGLYRS
jgi:hypothetical protein